MRKIMKIGLMLAAAMVSAAAGASEWPARTPAIFEGVNGYVHIPSAAVPINPSLDYKALFVTSAANEDVAKPNAMISRLAANFSGLRTGGVPAEKIGFAIIFFGKGADTLLTDTEYRRKYARDNPNAKLIASLLASGVKVFVCGQYMAGTNLPASHLVPGVQVAEAATLVTIRYANDGYAIVSD